MSKISLIIEREYLTRVQKKSFILMTILSPIIMVALVFAPIWLSKLSSDETRLIAIIDQTGLYKDIYHDTDEYHYTPKGLYRPTRCGSTATKAPCPTPMSSSRTTCSTILRA